MMTLMATIAGAIAGGEGNEKRTDGELTDMRTGCYNTTAERA